MKRTIEVRTPSVSIKATINSAGQVLTREEVERARDQLADRLMEAAAYLPFGFNTPINRVRVK